MFCTKCGKENDAGATHCVQCSELLTPPQPQAASAATGPAQISRVPNYLVQAILVTIFCCLPFGIVAIVFAAQVNGKLQVGDINGAMESSRKAKLWSWIGFGSGLAIQIIILIISYFIGIGFQF